MTIEEKIQSIKNRLGLTSKEMDKLFNLQKGDNQQKIIKKITKISNIEEKSLLNSNIPIEEIYIQKTFNKKYSNLFKTYSETLKNYFPKNCKVFVLTKIKQKNSCQKFIDLFFHNSRSSVINEMNAFTPSFLIQNKDIHLLINFNDNNFTIIELNITSNDKTFIKNGYKYKKANEIKLK